MATHSNVDSPSASVSSMLDTLTQGHGLYDNVRVPVRLLTYIKKQYQLANEQRDSARLAGVEDDTILDDTIDDLEVRSTLRQYFSSDTAKSRPKSQRQRRTSAESLKLVQQVLKQQRMSNRQEDIDHFLALLWHLCQRKHTVAFSDLTDARRAAILHQYTHLSTWGVDVLQIRRVFSNIPGSELVFVVLCAIHKLKLANYIVCFAGRDKVWDMYAKLANYVWAVADSYQDNPYHNVAHAADVTVTCFSFLADDCGGLAAVLGPELQLAFIIAACIHDAGHVGVSNNFLVAVEHPLAVQYNDFSPLEQLHCATGFSTLRETGCNFLETFREQKREDYTKVRKVIIQLVLGTDMKHHFKNMAVLKNLVEDETADHGQTTSFKLLDILGDEDKLLLVLKQCLHAADISNPAKPWASCKFWTDCVMEEFYDQGDRERQLGLPISHGMDRLNPIPLPTFQIGFIKALVKPL